MFVFIDNNAKKKTVKLLTPTKKVLFLLNNIIEWTNKNFYLEQFSFYCYFINILFTLLKFVFCEINI